MRKNVIACQIVFNASYMKNWELFKILCVNRIEWIVTAVVNMKQAGRSIKRTS